MRYNNCTIQRTFVRTSSTVNLTTGQFIERSKETLKEACNTPLFGQYQNTGICRSCAKGWEIETNRFASEAERARATTPQKNGD